MNLRQSIKLGLLSLMPSLSLFAFHPASQNPSLKSNPHIECYESGDRGQLRGNNPFRQFGVVHFQWGIAGYVNLINPSTWYPVTLSSTNKKLSAHRNIGSTQGDVELTDNGLKIGEAGNYAVSFKAVIDSESAGSPTIQVSIAVNGVVDPNNPISATITLVYGRTDSLYNSGILENVPADAYITLVANGNAPVNVGVWNLTAFKIPADS